MARVSNIVLFFNIMWIALQVKIIMQKMQWISINMLLHLDHPILEFVSRNYCGNTPVSCSTFFKEVNCLCNKFKRVSSETYLKSWNELINLCLQTLAIKWKATNDVLQLTYRACRSGGNRISSARLTEDKFKNKSWWYAHS